MAVTKALVASLLLVSCTAVVKALSSLTCQGDNFEISCPGLGEVIVLTEVFYGRRTMDSCDSWAVQEDTVTNCVEEDAYSDLTRLCYGQTLCTIPAYDMEAVLGNPCPGVRKYLEIEYKCALLSELHSICDDDIDADTDHHGFIYSPNYPADYDNADFCRLRILAQEGQEVRIALYDVDTQYVSLDGAEYCYDPLVFMLPDYSDKTFCSKLQSTDLTWQWDSTFIQHILTISFETSEYTSSRGFLFEYNVTGCAGDDRPPAPANGYILSYEPSRLVTYHCVDGYTLQPAYYNQATCHGYTWEGTVGQCVPAPSSPATTKTSTSAATTTSTTTTSTTSTPTTSTASPTTRMTTTVSSTTQSTSSPTTLPTTTSSTTSLPVTSITTSATGLPVSTTSVVPPVKTTTTTTQPTTTATTATTTTTSTTTTTKSTTGTTKSPSTSEKYITATEEPIDPSSSITPEKNSPDKTDEVQSTTHEPFDKTTLKVTTTTNTAVVQPLIIGVVVLVVGILMIIGVAICTRRIIRRRRKLEDQDSADSLRPSPHACVSIPDTYAGVGFAKQNAGIMQTSGKDSMTGSNITENSDSTFYDSADDGSMLTSARPKHYTNTESDEFLTGSGSEVYNSGSGLIENEIYDYRHRMSLHTIQEEPSSPPESGAFHEENKMETSIPNSELSSVLNEPTAPPPLHTRPVSLNDNKDGNKGLPIPKVDYPLFKDDFTGNLTNYLDSRRVSV